MYDVRRLRLLKELADRGTLAEVAAALNFSPSSVSQQLALLEREVGVPLLIPSGRRVVLTPEAQTLAERAGEVLSLLERTESEIAARTVTVSGTVRLAIFQTGAYNLANIAELVTGPTSGRRFPRAGRTPGRTPRASSDPCGPSAA